MSSDDLLYDNPKPVWDLPDQEALMWLRKLYPDLPNIEYGAMLALMRGQEISCMRVATEEEYAEHLLSLDDPDTIWWPRKKDS